MHYKFISLHHGYMDRYINLLCCVNSSSMEPNNHNMPILLDRKDVELVKPSSSTPSHILSLSSIDNNYDLELICRTIYVYQARTNYPNGNVGSQQGSTLDCAGNPDPARVIKEALSAVLVHYYPLAGKLKRHSDGILRINCNTGGGGGVPFLEATANCQLSYLGYLDGVDFQTAKQFVFEMPTNSEEGYHPLLLQVTKFACGGFTIGMGLSHSVCDGFGAAQFFRALAELASGKSEPSVKPVWERGRLVSKPCEHPMQPPVEKASLATSPHCLTADLIHECISVRSGSIKKLKQSLMKETGIESFTVVEVLGAYIWRSRVRALELSPNGKTFLSLTMGIRQFLFNHPLLPAGYYGNAFVPSQTVVLTARDLQGHKGSLSRAAKLIKESKKIASSTEYIMNMLSVFESLRKQNIRNDQGTGAALVLTDWRRLDLLEEVDFGWKKAVNIMPLPWNMFGYVDLCVLLPPFSLDDAMKGGVRVLVSLPRTAMAKFKEEMTALELGDDSALI